MMIMFNLLTRLFTLYRLDGLIFIKIKTKLSVDWKNGLVGSEQKNITWYNYLIYK